MGKTLTAVLVHILLVVAVIVGMGTLGILANDQEKTTEKFTGELERNVTIRVLENDTAKQQGYLKYILDAFNEQYKEYGIEVVDANMGEYTDLELQGPYGYGPDIVFQANDTIMKYVDGKHVLPLPTKMLDCYSVVDEKAWSAYKQTVNNQSYTFGVPVNIQQPLLYYREDMLPEDWKENWDDDKNNVPDMIENWTDLYRYSKHIRKTSNGKKFGYMKSLNDGYFASGYYLSYGGYVFGGEDSRDTSDIGFSKGESYKGARIIRQLASVMNLECTEDTITKNSYSKIADGTYFATMTTPDVLGLFRAELALQYEKEGYSKLDAQNMAIENIKTVNVPKLPVSGNLEDESQGMKDMTVMGGVNGYAISSYTESPNACLAFVNFATSYASILKRNELLGISPARIDVAEKLGGLNSIINNNLKNGTNYIMPSVRALAQVWTPLQTFCATLADDVLKDKNKYVTDEALLQGLKKVDKQIYDAIHTLAG